MRPPDTIPAGPPSELMDAVLERLQYAVDTQRLLVRLLDVELERLRRSTILIRGIEDDVICRAAFAEQLTEQAERLAKAVAS